MFLNYGFGVGVICLACTALSACSVRPEGVPEDAQYVGSWKDGVWIACNSDDVPECEIFNKRGGLRFTGRFAIVDSFNSCTKGFTAVIFPFEGRFLVPVHVRSADGGYYLFGSPAAEDLPDAISRAANELYDFTDIEVEVGELDACGDGVYRVLVSGELRIQRPIFASQYFEMRMGF